MAGQGILKESSIWISKMDNSRDFFMPFGNTPAGKELNKIYESYRQYSFAAQSGGSLEAACRPICHKMKLSQTAFDILMFLAAHPDCSTAKDICRARGIRPNMVSFNVERLVEEGYLQRQAVPGDRRKIRLLCTDKAQEILRRAAEWQSILQHNSGRNERRRDIGFEQNIALICRNAEKLRNS